MKLDDWITEEEYATGYRKCTLRHAQRERKLGISPPYVKQGKRVIYRVSGIQEYLLAKEQKPVRA